MGWKPRNTQWLRRKIGEANLRGRCLEEWLVHGHGGIHLSPAEISGSCWGWMLLDAPGPEEVGFLWISMDFLSLSNVAI